MSDEKIDEEKAEKLVEEKIEKTFCRDCFKNS